MRFLINSAVTLRAAGIAATALLASSFVAQAADLQRPIYTKAPAYVEQTYNWSGFYAGIVGGGSFGDISGYNVGGTLGYNWQTGRIVYGIEGDLSYTSNDGTLSGTALTEDYFATVRGRIGYAWTDRMMVFATGGYAGANISATALGLSQEKFSNGYALGAGVEYAIMPRWTVKGEYLYVNYMDQDYFQGTAAARTISLTDSLFRVGLNYKF